MRCQHCNSPCRYIGEQHGTEKYYGRRMYLWTCTGCGTTISQFESVPTGKASRAVPADVPIAKQSLRKPKR